MPASALVGLEHATPGEQLALVAARAEQVIDQVVRKRRDEALRAAGEGERVHLAGRTLTSAVGRSATCTALQVQRPAAGAEQEQLVEPGVAGAGELPAVQRRARRDGLDVQRIGQVGRLAEEPVAADRRCAHVRNVQVLAGCGHGRPGPAAPPFARRHVPRATPRRHTMKTQVCIIGGGPSGLLMSQLLHLKGHR